MQAHHERDAQGVVGAHSCLHVEYVNTATLRTSKVRFLIIFAGPDPDTPKPRYGSGCSGPGLRLDGLRV